MKKGSPSKFYRFVQKSKKKTRNIHAIVIDVLKGLNIDHKEFHIAGY